VLGRDGGLLVFGRDVAADRATSAVGRTRPRVTVEHASSISGSMPMSVLSEALRPFT